jgi:hypothetical protein
MLTTIQQRLSFHLLHKNNNFKIFKTIVLLLFCMHMKLEEKGIR